MKRTILLLVSLLFITLGMAQEKKLSIKDASFLNPATRPQGLRNLAWMGNSDAYTFIEGQALVRGRLNAESRDTVLRLSDISGAMVAAGAEELKRFPSIEWKDASTFTFHSGSKVWGYNLSERKAKVIATYPENASDQVMEEGSFALAYTVDNNLFIHKEGKEIQVTNDQDKGIVNGQTVHRSEFGISGGIFWSPDGSKLAFYRKDERQVAEYPLVEIGGRIAEMKTTRYPMAGEKSENVTLGIFDLNAGTTVFMQTGEPADQYLTSVTWAPDGASVYIGLLNRGQDHLKLNRYDAVTGQLQKTLFEEKDPMYVEPEHPLYFLPNDPSKFLWLSERDGYQHFYLYNTEGQLLNQVTRGEWMVTEFKGFDPKGRSVYFMSTAAGPLEEQLYSADLKKGRLQRITYAPGTHTVVFREDMAYLFDVYSSTTVAREYLLLNNGGSLVEMLMEDKDPLEGYSLGEMKMFTIKADDGSDLHCRMILPPGFDASRKYPALVYVYGGPHAQLVTNSWLGGAGLFLNYMAQEGFVVFTLDNRGSAHRGKAFEQALFRNCGSVEVADQMKGVEYLKSLPYVDAGRIGVNGWSYGGFMTISMMLKNPGVFKAGCAGGPVIDWKYYEVMYGERYMDTPQDNPEGYKASSLLNYVDQLEGKLLVIHGTVDPVVVWQHSLEFLKKCVDEGKQVDYFVYPGHEHNVGGKDRMHLNQKIAEYFKENL
jgi:dipeptidyl-peptidase-4